MVEEGGGQGSKDFAGQDVLRRVKWRVFGPLVLLVVVMLLGVGVLLVTTVKNGKEAANKKVTQARMRRVADVVETFASKQEPYRVPSSLKEAYGGAVEAREADRLDAWGNPLIYKVDSASRFHLESGGPDGFWGTADDVTHHP